MGYDIVPQVSSSWQAIEGRRRAEARGQKGSCTTFDRAVLFFVCPRGCDRPYRFRVGYGASAYGNRESLDIVNVEIGVRRDGLNVQCC